jgi:hypothetical protein
MLYAILCYNQEDVTCGWSKEHEDGVIGKLIAVQDRLARLMPTTAATTLRKDREPPLVLDGPFAETKEQLLGFYVVDCDSLDGALAIAMDLGAANPGGSYEIRPIALFQPGEVGGAVSEVVGT